MSSCMSFVVRFGKSMDVLSMLSIGDLCVAVWCVGCGVVQCGVRFDLMQRGVVTSASHVHPEAHTCTHTNSARTCIGVGVLVGCAAEG